MISTSFHRKFIPPSSHWMTHKARKSMARQATTEEKSNFASSSSSWYRQLLGTSSWSNWYGTPTLKRTSLLDVSTHNHKMIYLQIQTRKWKLICMRFKRVFLLFQSSNSPSDADSKAWNQTRNLHDKRTRN